MDETYAHERATGEGMPPGPSYDGLIPELSELSRLRRELRAQREGMGREIGRLAEEARRYYRADGSYELLDSAEEVVERRKAAAVENEQLKAELHEAADLLDGCGQHFDRKGQFADASRYAYAALKARRVAGPESVPGPDGEGSDTD